MNDLENPFVAHEKPGFKRVYDQLIFLYSIFYILIYYYWKPSQMYLVISLVEADSNGCFSNGCFPGKNKGQQQIWFIENILNKKYSALYFKFISTNFQYFLPLF